jgi:hypothetical protein
MNLIMVVGGPEVEVVLVVRAAQAQKYTVVVDKVAS